jgi:hypothetical protein
VGSQTRFCAFGIPVLARLRLPRFARNDMIVRGRTTLDQVEGRLYEENALRRHYEQVCQRRFL